jgi:N-acyl-D-amino-acid deacylase
MEKLMSVDLAIRNGLVVDGTGSEPRAADVGVSDGRIVAIGTVDERARREIDAEGHVVAPGFIDGHTHMDAQVFWDPLGTCSCYHGVTTVVMGNCGFSLAPTRSNEHELVVRNLERAEDIAPEALAAGLDWTWETFPEYLDALARTPKGINYAAQIGHSALRTWSMGLRGFEQAATPDDLAVMQQHLRESLRAGAIGFTTSLSPGHRTSDDRPVASRQASWEELSELVGVLAAEQRGVFELALDVDVRSEDPDIRRAGRDRLYRLGVDSKVPVTFGVPALPPRAGELLALIDATNQAGGRMFGQSHSRGITAILSFRAQLPFDRLPEWRELRARPLAEQAAALRNPEVRARLVAIASTNNYSPTVGAEAPPPDWERLLVMDKPLPPYPTVAELARERGISPVELMIELGLATDFGQCFIQGFRGHSNAPDELLVVMRHPATVMTFSDSGAHVSQIMDSSIQTHLLSYWVRQEQAFSLPEAIRMITAVPAAAWGFNDRGLLREGMVADVNVFDPATVGPEMPTVVNDLPAGMKRLHQKATGFLATIVGGEVVLSNTEHTGALPGQLIRDGARWSR